MDDWAAVAIAIGIPLVTIAALGIVWVLVDRKTVVFQRDANGNIVSITTV